MKLIWELPLPSSNDLQPSLEIQPGRVCKLTFNLDEDEPNVRGSIVFREVVAYRCTYLYGLTAELIRSSYDKLVEVEDSSWLREVRSAAQSKGVADLKLFRICFDDGPCFEVICTRVETPPAPGP